MALQWLSWVAFTEKRHISHAGNSGEVRVGNYYLDGYTKVGCQKIGYLFQGCFYHGCPKCYDPKTYNPVLQKSMGALYATFEKYCANLRKMAIKLVTIWEWEFGKMRKENPTLDKYVKGLSFTARLNPRDALFGGRVGPFKLYYESQSRGSRTNG